MEHTQGEAGIESKFGPREGDPRYFVKIGEQVMFVTCVANDKANAARLVHCWNAHDELVKTLKEVLLCVKQPDCATCTNKHCNADDEGPIERAETIIKAEQS